MTDRGTPALDIQDLSLQFDGRPLFSRFCLRLEPGERVILTGPSGCGKSSLLRCILGFVAPPGGRIRILGEDLTAQAVWPLRRRMAYVPQEPALGRGSVLEILGRPLAYQANRHLRVTQLDIEALADALGLPGVLLGKPITDLSGGEKQRVAILSALLLDRPLLILDEPTSALDDDSAARVTDTLRKHASGAILAVCHDPQDLAVGSAVVRLGEGNPRA